MIIQNIKTWEKLKKECIQYLWLHKFLLNDILGSTK